jgi:hypothetical protein
MPSSDGGDDFLWIGGPCEGSGLCVVFFEETIDRGMKVGDGAEDAALQSALVSLAKKPSTALSREHEVGVKWKVQRG